jgi:hypothetical protein
MIVLRHPLAPCAIWQILKTNRIDKAPDRSAVT